MLEALTAYPTDRSCYTCDFYSVGETIDGVQDAACRHHQHADIPVGFRERGCDAHKEEGAPF